MAGAVAARWLLTAVFAAAGLGSLPVPGRVGTARVAARVSEVFHALMCTALIAMTWRSEPIAPTWFEPALFGCAVVWFGLRRPGRSRGFPGAQAAWPASCADGGRHDLDDHGHARRFAHGAGRACTRCHARHVPACCARGGAGHLRPARGVLRARSCAMVRVCHRSWAAGDRQGRGRSRRYECRDGGDAAGVALNPGNGAGNQEKAPVRPSVSRDTHSRRRGRLGRAARGGRGGGRANGSRVRGAARENGTAAGPGHILAIGLADGNWRPT